jgi:hypothetical protein
MEDLISDDGHDDGLEPVSIRDSLKAAMEGPEEEGGEGRVGDPAKVVDPARVVDAGKADQPVRAEAGRVEEDSQAAAIKAPSSWSADAKAKFADAPPEVRAAIAKREEEINKGFRVLQDYKGLEQFTPLIRQAGTTHADVLRKAVDYETALRRDPVGTIRYVAQLAGVDLAALANGQPQGRPQQAQPQFRPEMVEQLVNRTLRQREVEGTIEAFLSDPKHMHAETVIDDMVALIETGRASDLKDAYERACWQNPTIREGLIKQASPAPVTAKANPADQARKAARSITGSSTPGPSRGAEARPPSSVREALQEAWTSQGTRA